MARYVRRFKLGLKPNQLYVGLSIILPSHQSTYFSSRIIMHYVVAFVSLRFALPDTRVLNSFEELCITRLVAFKNAIFYTFWVFPSLTTSWLLNDSLPDRTFHLFQPVTTGCWEFVLGSYLVILFSGVLWSKMSQTFLEFTIVSFQHDQDHSCYSVIFALFSLLSMRKF